MTDRKGGVADNFVLAKDSLKIAPCMPYVLQRNGDSFHRSLFISTREDVSEKLRCLLTVIIMHLLENLPDNVSRIIMIMCSSIMPVWHCACVSVISQCLLKLYHRLTGCTVTFHVISKFHHRYGIARKQS